MPDGRHYNSLQISADRRYSNGLKVGAAYTLSKSEDNGSTKRDVVWNTYDDSNFWGPASFDRRHVLSVYYIYDLPFWKDQNTLLKNLAGGWQISGASIFRTGTPFSVTRTNDIAGVGDGNFGQPYNVVADPIGNANRQFSAGSGNDTNYWIDPASFAVPANGTFGNGDAQPRVQPRRTELGHRVLQEFPAPRNAEAAVPGGDLQLHQPRELEQRRLERSEQRQLRAHHDEERRAPGRAAEPEIPVLTEVTERTA